MKIVSIILACIFAFLLCAWFVCNPAEAQEVKIEPLPDSILLAPLPDRRGYSTLPGWSAGYRFDFNIGNSRGKFGHFFNSFSNKIVTNDTRMLKFSKKYHLTLPNIGGADSAPPNRRSSITSRR